ncbi:MAG: hypothetical protein HOQ05_01595 [Corynebacteriales bacterium]|nr:hypothetical protein [Mycobacteriales bacterium]
MTNPDPQGSPVQVTESDTDLLLRGDVLANHTDQVLASLQSAQARALERSDILQIASWHRANSVQARGLLGKIGDRAPHHRDRARALVQRIQDQEQAFSTWLREERNIPDLEQALRDAEQAGEPFGYAQNVRHGDYMLALAPLGQRGVNEIFSRAPMTVTGITPPMPAAPPSVGPQAGGPSSSYVPPQPAPSSTTGTVPPGTTAPTASGAASVVTPPVTPPATVTDAEIDALREKMSHAHVSLTSNIELKKDGTAQRPNGDAYLPGTGAANYQSEQIALELNNIIDADAQRVLSDPRAADIRAQAQELQRMWLATRTPNADDAVNDQEVLASLDRWGLAQTAVASGSGPTDSEGKLKLRLPATTREVDLAGLAALADDIVADAAYERQKIEQNEIAARQAFDNGDIDEPTMRAHLNQAATDRLKVQLDEAAQLAYLFDSNKDLLRWGASEAAGADANDYVTKLAARRSEAAAALAQSRGYLKGKGLLTPENEKHLDLLSNKLNNGRIAMALGANRSPNPSGIDTKPGSDPKATSPFDALRAKNAGKKDPDATDPDADASAEPSDKEKALQEQLDKAEQEAKAQKEQAAEREQQLQQQMEANRFDQDSMYSPNMGGQAMQRMRQRYEQTKKNAQEFAGSIVAMFGDVLGGTEDILTGGLMSINMGGGGVSPQSSGPSRRMM